MITLFRSIFIVRLICIIVYQDLAVAAAFSLPPFISRQVFRDAPISDSILRPLSNNSTISGLTADFNLIAATAKLAPAKGKLSFSQSMIAGAISRTIAQTVMHPANTYKTLLQLRHRGAAAGISSAGAKSLTAGITIDRLFRGADAQFIMSLPHGAFQFFVIENVRSILTPLVNKYEAVNGNRRLQFVDALSDFSASAVSTVVCSIVSTPQMVLTDRLMAGIYTTFPEAVRTIYQTEGMLGFYAGWWPALAQKIPSYSLTWMFFQQLKRLHNDVFKMKPTSETNFVMGAVAAAGSVAVMIPMDTIKTRLVTQVGSIPLPYTGVRNCFFRIIKEEGVGALYRSLPPRLIAVVPMIAIQFGVYEHLKYKFIQENNVVCNR